MNLDERALFISFAVLFGLAVTIALLVGPNGWDDGAITLAYSRTFAETGRIALTSASEVSEGFSSVGWFLLNAAIALAKPGFVGAILAAQLLAALFLGIGLFFAWLIARSLALRSTTTCAILVTLAAFGPSLSEIANGMEMTLLMASGLGLCVGLHFRRSPLLVVLCSIVFLFTRFEAMIYYAALVAPLLLQRRHGTFLALAVFGLCLVGLQEGVRYLVFEDIVPNTVHAKSQAPYYLFGLNALKATALRMAETVLIVLPIALLGIALALRGDWRSVRKGQEMLILLSPAVAVVGFALLIRQNSGYAGRIQFLAFPFLLLLFGLIFDAFAKDMLGDRAHRMLAIASAMTVLLSWPLSAGLVFKAATDFGRVDQSASSQPMATTPASYRLTGLAVEKVRHLLGRDVMVFMTPDIGGAALCCNALRIVDLGLLANRRLAVEGYAALPAVLSKENPDVIEIHGVWGDASKLYGNPTFSKGYEPAIIDGTRLFLRKDIFQALAAKTGMLCPTGRSDCRTEALERHRYINVAAPADDRAFLNHPAFLAVER